MEWIELLKYLSNGKMPMVKDTKTGKIGRVVVIKDNGRHKGISMSGEHYDTWYHDSDAVDARTKYIRDLQIIEDVE